MANFHAEPCSRFYLGYEMTEGVANLLAGEQAYFFISLPSRSESYTLSRLRLPTRKVILLPPLFGTENRSSRITISLRPRPVLLSETMVHQTNCDYRS